MKKTKDAKNQLRRAQRPASDESTSYASWIVELKRRYRATQIKAAVAVNSALIEFYWNLGRDIAERYQEANLGNDFYRQMSFDLKDGNPEAKGLSPQTLKYCGYFYRLYAIPAGGQQVVDLLALTRGQQAVDPGKVQQVVAKSGRRNRPQPVDDNNVPQLVEQLVLVLLGHHVQIIDKCKGNRDKFPPDSMFELTTAESQVLRSKISTLEQGENLRSRISTATTS